MEDLSFDYQLQSFVLPSPFLIFCLESQQLFKFYCETFSEEKERAAITHTHTHTHTHTSCPFDLPDLDFMNILFSLL